MKYPLNDPLTIYQILRFDFVVAQVLTAGERICVHQCIGQGIMPSPALLLKIGNLLNTMEEVKWEPPELRYNADREIEIQIKNGRWILLNKNKD